MEFYQAGKGILVCDTTFTKAAYKAVEKIDKPIELVGLEEIKTFWFANGLNHQNSFCICNVGTIPGL